MAPDEKQSDLTTSVVDQATIGGSVSDPDGGHLNHRAGDNDPPSGTGIGDHSGNGAAAPFGGAGELGAAHRRFANASFSCSTTMYWLPRNPSSSPWVCRLINTIRLARESPVARETMGIWAVASAGVMSGS